MGQVKLWMSWTRDVFDMGISWKGTDMGVRDYFDPFLRQWFAQVEVKPEMIGHYLGEFSISYKPVIVTFITIFFIVMVIAIVRAPLYSWSFFFIGQVNHHIHRKIFLILINIGLTIFVAQVKHGRPGIGATHSSRFIPLKWPSWVSWASWASWSNDHREHLSIKNYVVSIIEAILQNHPC